MRQRGGEVSAAWTDEDKALLRKLREQGVTMPEIARRLGRSEPSVEHQRRKLGLALEEQAMEQQGEFKASDGFLSGYLIVWRSRCACAMCGEWIVMGDVVAKHRQRRATTEDDMHRPFYRHVDCKKGRVSE